MNILPVPVRTNFLEGEYRWAPGLARVSVSSTADLGLAQYLAQELERRCRIPASIRGASDGQPAHVALRIAQCSELQGVPLKGEGYVLDVTSRGVFIVAEAHAGLFYGVQSLLQLLPWSAEQPSADLRLPACHVLDYPRFRWRGTLLDVGRHMYSVAFIKKLLDVLAMHKVNKFHWHLTEDQGWRLEIKAFPRLTEVGAWRGHGTARYGGFYTQDDVHAVVAYAAERHIEVIPEIELPGHCKAALACYPELSCTGEADEVPTQWGVQTDVYCAGKESTFAFLEAVLDEVTALFPSQYIHIGGDECPKARWAACPACQRRIRDERLGDEERLQTWFIERVARFVQARGKTIIGWDEILEGGIPQGAVVMSWRGSSGGILAAKSQHQVIMCPNNRCYFDYRQSTNLQEPGTWYAVLPLEWVYMFDPYCRRISEYLQQQRQQEEAEEARPTMADADDMLSGGEERDTEGGGSGMQLDGPMGEGSGGGGKGSDALESGSEAAAPVSDVHMDRVESVSGQLAHTMTKADEQYIMGGQANLWTEFIADEVTAEYMLLPRLCALAECVWSPPSRRNWRSFLERAQAMLDRLRTAGYNYRPLVNAA